MQYSTKRATIIVFLQGIADNKKAEKAVSTLTVHDLNRETGLDVLLRSLIMHLKMKLLKTLIAFI